MIIKKFNAQFKKKKSVIFISPYFNRAKELGPDGKGKGGKKIIDLDYNENDDDEEEGDEGEQDGSDDNKEQGGGALSNSSTNYRNAELAMLCTKSVRLCTRRKAKCSSHNMMISDLSDLYFAFFRQF